MIFISKKRFENEVRSRVEQELCKMEENRWRAEEIRELNNRINRLETRLEKVEEMHGIPTNVKAVPTYGY